jgi:NitT/TauT family transport system permease protein
MKNFLGPAAVGMLFLCGWEWVCGQGWVSPILLPSPLDTAGYLIGSVRDGLLPEAVGITLRRLVIGYAMGLALGVGLGLLCYASSLARDTLGLAALGLQTLPSVCWAPLAILWFGQTEGAMWFVVVMGSMWAVAIASENAVRGVPPLYIRAARVMGARGIYLWAGVMFPAAQPQLLAGAKLGWAFAWRSLMAAEIYVTIIEHMGLGQMLHFSRELNAMDQVMAVMMVIILVGLLADRLVFLPLERYLRRTRGL